MAINIFDELSRTYTPQSDGTIKVKGGKKALTNAMVAIELMSKGVQNETMESLDGIIEQWKKENNPDIKVEFMLDKLKESPTNVLKPNDWRLLNNFRWAISSAGTQLLFFREKGDSNEYRVVEDLDNVFTMIALNNETYKEIAGIYTEIILDAYERGAFTEMLVWDLNTKSGEDKMPKYPRFSLAEYLRKSIDHVLASIAYKIPHPEIITNDPKKPCFVYSDIDRTESLPGETYEDWEAWVGYRFRNEMDRNIFRAYIYSIYDSKNTARQALWLVDEGQTGKTTMINAIVASMKSGAMAMNDQGGANKEFFGSTVYGKRLLTAPDNKNTSLIRKGIIHQILGGDNIPIEFKGSSTFMGKVHCKMIIASNYYPSIDTTQVHEKSRVLILELVPNKDIDDKEIVKKFTHGTSSQVIEERLISQLPAFILSCREAYKQLCPTQNNIILPKEADEKMFDGISAEDTERYEYISMTYFYKSKEASISKAMMQQMFKILYGKGATNHIYADFKKYLRHTTPHYAEGKEFIGENRVGVIRGIGMNIDKLEEHKGIWDDDEINQYISQVKESKEKA